ncbi:MAG: HNH endonuclease [Planctomycetales bacterium]|nr:HNH endonuclease [Planctomycetales bacterium]
MVRGFEIDHVVPVSKSPDLALDYDNLVYACARCNGTKSDQSIPDPYFTLTDGSIQIDSKAKAVGATPNSRKLIHQLDLNSPLMIEWRKLMLEFERLSESKPDALERLTRLPSDLPDLRKLRPKANSQPNGIALSWKLKESSS